MIVVMMEKFGGEQGHIYTSLIPSRSGSPRFLKGVAILGLPDMLVKWGWNNEVTNQEYIPDTLAEPELESEHEMTPSHN